MRFELFTRLGLRGRKWYFRMRHRNGQIIGQSEGYSRKIDAVECVEGIRVNANSAPVIVVDR